jgi:RimJ/RimL family protein N-acetyltransferase
VDFSNIYNKFEFLQKTFVFIAEVQRTRPEIARIELESRAGNQKSIGLYQRTGFVQEGKMRNKTRNKDGSFEDSILMAWTNPEFKYG